MPPQQPHQIPISRFHVTCLFASPSCHQEILPSLSMSRVSSFLHATINSWLFNWVVMTRINTIYLLPHPAIQRWLGHPFISLYSDLRACGRRPQSRVMIGSLSRIRRTTTAALVLSCAHQQDHRRVHAGSFRFRISDCIPWLSLGQRHRPYRRPARLEFRTIDRIFRPQQDDRGRRL